MSTETNRPRRETHSLDHASRIRVAITGIGVKTPAGCDVKTFADTVFAGRPTATPVTAFDTTGLPSTIACQVHDFDATSYLPAKVRRRMDRFSQFGFTAAMDALTDAGNPPVDPSRAAVVTGVCIGGLQTGTEQSVIAHTQGGHAISPMTATMFMFNSPGAYVCMELGWHGPHQTIATACASGTDAIGSATRLIRDGTADLVLAGGADTGGVSMLMLASFGHAGALSTRNHDPAGASRPFDADRDGYVMGEGAAYLLLERLDSALSRGARIYGEVAGYASSSDGHHIAAPHPRGRWAAACMKAAIHDAGLTPEAVRQVNSHGTGTQLGDACEAQALRTIFGSLQPPVTSSKGVFGHLMGASGAAEAAVTALSALRGLVPPTAGHDKLASDCAGIDVVSGAPSAVGAGPVLSHSSGVGGQNASLVISTVPAPTTSEGPLRERR